MKVLLIYPTITIYGKDPSGGANMPPLGLAYIAAYLEKLGHEVKILDCLAEGTGVQKIGSGFRSGLNDAGIKKMIKSFSPGVVGIASMFSAYAKDAYRIASLVKNIDPKIPIVFGGANACALTEDILKNKDVDLCVIGEGELTFAEIVEKISLKKSYHDVKGIAYRKGQRVIFTEERELIKDLDQLPFPARHLLPMETYFKKHKNDFVYYDRHTFMITSRGCPGNCIYCSIHSIWRHTWRARSAQNIVEEIEFLIKTYGIKEIHFVDDNLTVNKRRIHEICDLLIDKKLNIKWTCPNGVAIWTLDEELLDKMKRSGCYRLTFGIESGSSTTQKFIRKNLNLDYAKRMIAYANKIGLWTLSTFIIGFPYEDEQSINETINYAISSKTDFATFYVLMPFPGTDIWEILEKEKLISKKEFFDEIGYFLTVRGLNSKFFSCQKIRDFSSLAHKKLLRSQLRRFLFHPSGYLRKISSLGDLKYTIKLFNQFLMLIYYSIRIKERIGGALYHKTFNRK